jgi:hypothetical protein
LKAALESEAKRTKTSASTIVAAALSKYLGHQLHTLFQVSKQNIAGQQRSLLRGYTPGIVAILPWNGVRPDRSLPW